jgi:Rrf2 family protein
MFSKTCEYAIRAVIYISASTSKLSKAGIGEISSGIEAPAHFTAKVLQLLVHYNIIHSQKGVNGGFYMDQQQRKKSLIDTVRAIDGDYLFTNCALGLKQCSAKEPCPLHDKFMTIRENLRSMMQDSTIDEMAKGIKDGKKRLKTEKIYER